MLDAIVDSPPGPQAHRHSLLRSLLQTRHRSRQTAASASASARDDDDENCAPATAKVLPAGGAVPRKHASGAAAATMQQGAGRRPLGQLDANTASLAASRGLDHLQQPQQQEKEQHPPSTETQVSCNPPQKASTTPAALPGRETAPGRPAQQPGIPARSTTSTSASLADTLLAAPWQADGGAAVMQRRPGVASRAASSTCAPSRSARGGTSSSTSTSTGSGASSRLSASLAGVELPLFLRMHPGVPALLRRHAAAQAAAHHTGSSGGAGNPPRGQGWLRHLETGHRQQQQLLQAAGATRAPRPAVGPLQANLMWPAGSWTQPGPLRLAMAAGAAGPAGLPERVPPASSVTSTSAGVQHVHAPPSGQAPARPRLPGLACITQAPSVPSAGSRMPAAAGTMRTCHGVPPAPPAGAGLYFAPADPCPSPGAHSCSSLDDTAQSGLSYRLAAADPLRTPFAGASPDNDDDYIRQLWDVWHGHGQHALHYKVADRRTAQESLTHKYGCRPRACRRLSWGDEKQA